MTSFLTTFSANSFITLGLGAVLGLVFGSFLNVVIYRLPRMMQHEWDEHVEQEIASRQAKAGLEDHQRAHEQAHQQAFVETSQAASQDLPQDTSAQTQPAFNLGWTVTRPHCGHQIAWYEHIPILSYVFLKGRCRSCATPIGLRYPLIELITAALFAVCFYRYGLGLEAVLWCTFSAILVALAAIDWDTTLLPDDLNQPLLWIGLVASALGLTGISLGTSLAGAVIGFLFFWSLYWLFRGLTGKEGLGRGDFKLLAALGAWLGWQALPGILIIAGLTGLIAGLIMRKKGTLRDGIHIPFGPFLVLGGLILMVYPPWRTLVHF
jgi:leader peptidase (prepilin peptidase)/N-methyltransferase